MARALQLLREQLAPSRPAVTLGTLVKPWADTHNRLASFKCDLARAELVLSWANSEGPHMGVPLRERTVESLTAGDLDLYRAWRYSTTTRRKGPPTPSTVNREVMAIKRILNHAVSRDIIQRSPLRGHNAEHEDNIREVVIEEDGLDLILYACGSNQTLRAFIVLAYDSGMRKGELMACRWSWLDPSRGFVHVPGSHTKTGKPRVTDLSTRAWEELQRLPRHFKTDLVFARGDTGASYNERWFSKHFVEAVERSGVVGRNGVAPRIHDLRRSFVTIARRRGISETVIMRKTGHQDHAVFLRYSIVGHEDLDASWETMEKGRGDDRQTLSDARRAPKTSPGGHTHMRRLKGS